MISHLTLLLSSLGFASFFLLLQLLNVHVPSSVCVCVCVCAVAFRSSAMGSTDVTHGAAHSTAAAKEAKTTSLPVLQANQDVFSSLV